MENKFKFLLVVCGIVALVGCEKNDETRSIDPTIDNEAPVLREKANFGVGVAVKVNQLTDQYSTVVNESFNRLTAEYEMKMAHVWRGENEYKWNNIDGLIYYARKNNMDIHGHTILWYRSYPDWFKKPNYDSVSFENIIKSYIETLVGKYKGGIKSWDVANEIFNDDGTLRNDGCPVFKTFNDPIGFYARCFKYVKNADPHAKLFYNDYSISLAQKKRLAIKNMVKRFKSEGYPIDGLGDQFHIMLSNSKNHLQKGLMDMAGTGLLIHLSELDVRVNIHKSDNYVFSADEQQKQANMYQFIVESYEKLPQKQKFGITLWGVSDAHSWLTNWWHPKEYPLLFDKSYQRKPAYAGFLKGLSSD